jgi:hypothetical protein
MDNSPMLQSTSQSDYPIDYNDLPPEVMQAMEMERQALASQQNNNRQMQQMGGMGGMGMSNPFAMQPYRNMGGFPDMPLSYGGSLTESLINDNEVPAAIKKKFWFVFHKDNTLGFIDEQRKKDKMLAFDIIKTDVLNAIPYYDYNFERELEFDVLRNVFETKLDRAMGFKGGGVKNERIILQSQFTEQRQISEQSSGDVARSGFFKRLLGRR